PHHKDVLDGLIAEVVIDAEDLVLSEDLMDRFGELSCRLTVAPERLLDDDARPSGPAAKAMDADGFHDRRVRSRRRREIEQPIRVGAELDVEMVEALAESVVAMIVRGRDEEEVLGEGLPHLLVQRFGPAVLADRVVELRAVLIVGQRLARRADDREAARKEALQREAVERGHQLALGEVTRSAKDNDRRRLGRARQAQTFPQR